MSQAPATTPPPGLTGLDPAWSRLVTAADGDGVTRTWHVLDNWTSDHDPRLTLLCVHGNPSWSYLFRALLGDAPADVRVVAVDHLDMGFSERTGTFRRLATRVDDLSTVSAAMGITGPTVTVAHDWGGPVSLGWAQRHRDQLRGVVLMNTAVHQPAGSPAPSVIRLVRSRPMLRAVTTSTTAFIRGAFEMSDVRPSADIRDGFLAPYRTADRRLAIGQFVADIPLEPSHPSATTLDGIAAGLADMGDVPCLLLWGSADKVFSDLYLHDLEARLPHADVHRYPTAGHFVSEDTNCLTAALDWVGDLDHPTTAPTPTSAPARVATALLDVPKPPTPRLAIAEMSGRSIDTAEFDEQIAHTAAGLAAAGVEPGDRVALMIPPGVDLGVALMACWHAGAVVVLVDSGLGPRGMSAAMKAAYPNHLIGIPKALAAARALRWPGRRISTIELSQVQRLALGADTDLPTLGTAPGTVAVDRADTDLAAIAFTSGATGPSKGVLYTAARLAAQRDAIAARYAITLDDRLVAAFAPFALYGPLLGIPSVVPDMDVTAPATLTAGALGDAVARVDATLVFASPAALANVVRTADELTPVHRAAFAGVRLLLSAGAPVRPALLSAAAALFPNAVASTPYGMTECLPVAAIDLDEITAATGGDGVCVGHPLDSVEVRIRPLDDVGIAAGETTAEPGVVGEIIVRAPHMRLGYNRLWHADHAASQPPGWHATGDVGHLDATGRLWVGGRTGHVIATPQGVVTPVGLEQAIETLPDVDLAAVVGVGPRGVQQIVAIVQPTVSGSSARLADMALHDRVRAVVDHPIAAVFEVASLPVDRRHNSKIDRAGLAAWAEAALAGGRVSAP